MARKSILIVSDGEPAPPLMAQQRETLLNLARRFRAEGGVMICVGVRANGDGFRLMRDLATPGFFVNVHGGRAQVETALGELTRMLGVICAGTDTIDALGEQNSDPHPLPSLELFGQAAPVPPCRLDSKGKADPGAVPSEPDGGTIPYTYSNPY